ncbi:transcriptional regulator, HxlR family [Granulicella pectinivorans]|uniref:Transcriptional regulator, HxlR family n=1 Tax=Granulicella pectinivorans TaxID=474950 RepID=A0A1I6MA87_9BACT|nr:helix-turn-helix domain-containing protein [Granulicella pectinivorans]SFS12619.1 transcriptional regulator, HxlR family [Granulicella pectinivorans]
MQLQFTAQHVAEATDYEEIKVGCSMGGLLEVLTRPWTLHILWLLSRNGPMRFGALRRAVEGISARLLTVRLRTLEERGFVERSVRPTNPPEVTYIPTPRLADMNLFMEQLHKLSDKWQAEDVLKHTKPHVS